MIARPYWEPIRPLAQPKADPTREPTDLGVDDGVAKRIITTRLNNMAAVREENAIAAREVISRFGADPRRLVYDDEASETAAVVVPRKRCWRRWFQQDPGDQPGESEPADVRAGGSGLPRTVGFVMAKSKLSYGEGAWFGVPLREGGFAVGVLAR